MATRSDRGMVVFRADASPEIGGGHVVRCLALAEHLRERGWRCLFGVRPPTLATVPALQSAGVGIVELCGDPHDEARELGSRLRENAHWLVVDHYARDAAFERAARTWAQRVLAIDDGPGRAHDCDVLLDQTFGRAQRDYRARVPEGCRLLLGPQYALLRAQFAAARPAVLARRRKSAGIERILVSFGATDRRGLALIALDALRSAGLCVTVDVILGRSSPHRAAVHEAAARSPLDVVVHEDVSDMAALMGRADLGIGAAGCTAWERCSLGLPSLIAIDTDNQRDIAAALERTGASVILGRAETLTPKVIAQVLASLARDGDGLASMSAAAAAVCNGQGSERLGGIIAYE